MRQAEPTLVVDDLTMVFRRSERRLASSAALSKPLHP